MAADNTAPGGFSMEQWLKAAGFAMYTTAFHAHGHVNYKRCIHLSEEDIRAVGVNHSGDVWRLMNRVKELRKLSEEDTVKLLSVSTRN